MLNNRTLFIVFIIRPKLCEALTVSCVSQLMNEINKKFKCTKNKTDGTVGQTRDKNFMSCNKCFVDVFWKYQEQKIPLKYFTNF